MIIGAHSSDQCWQAASSAGTQALHAGQLQQARDSRALLVTTAAAATARAFATASCRWLGVLQQQSDSYMLEPDGRIMVMFT